MPYRENIFTAIKILNCREVYGFRNMKKDYLKIKFSSERRNKLSTIDYSNKYGAGWFDHV